MNEKNAAKKEGTGKDSKKIKMTETEKVSLMIINDE